MGIVTASAGSCTASAVGCTASAGMSSSGGAGVDIYMYIHLPFGIHFFCI